MEKYFRDIKEWRDWLDKNHAIEDVIWLVYYKKHTGEPALDYVESVEEALCYGWIDSLVKRIDDERYMRKFTPRRKGSVWSGHNLRRIKRLLAEGRMKPAGLKTIKGIDLDAEGHESSVNKVVPGEIPDYIFDALENSPDAMKTFQHLAPSHKKAYIGWVMDAKRQETRERRLSEVIERLQKGDKLGLK